MDDTELHYVTYDPDAIWEAMLLAYVEAGGDILYPGDEKDMLLRSVQADIVQVFAGVDNALRMQTLRYAVGEYLDVIGENRGCERIAAVAATATITITANATGSASVLAAGTAMTADGQVFWTLDGDVSLSGAAEAVTANVTCATPGTLGNGLVSGTALHLQTPQAAVAAIVAAADATGGLDEEADEAYRERIRTYGLANITTGPATQYEQAAMAVSSLILDARALNLGAGSVGIYLILSDSSGAAAVMDAVEDALNGEAVRPLTDSVSVHLATDVTYTLNVTVTADSGTVSLETLEAAAEEYQTWQDETVGRAFNPDRLVALLYQAGATRVVFASGSAFDGGSVEYTEIGENERCLGTITLTMT